MTGDAAGRELPLTGLSPGASLSLSFLSSSSLSADEAAGLAVGEAVGVAVGEGLRGGVSSGFSAGVQAPIKRLSAAVKNADINDLLIVFYLSNGSAVCGRGEESPEKTAGRGTGANGPRRRSGLKMRLSRG